MSGLEILAGVATAASGLVSAVGAMQQANAASAAADYNAKVQEANANASRAQAAVEVSDQMREQQRKLGRMRALYGASGVALSGSALDVLEDSAAEAANDNYRTLYKGELRAVGYQNQAQLDHMEAKSQRTAGNISFFGGMLKTAGGTAKYAASVL